MLKVGLTGGIGSGKTTVAKIFELLKVPVYYADAASKRLYDSDLELIENIKRAFGENIYNNNQLDRAQLAALVFNNPGKLNILNALVHPPTIRDANQWMLKQNASYVIKEAALIFESGSALGLDYVIGVSSPLELRITRAMQRDKATREEVSARANRQVSESLKMKLCDFIIYNNEKDLVIPQVLSIHEKLLTIATGNK